MFRDGGTVRLFRFVLFSVTVTWLFSLFSRIVFVLLRLTPSCVLTGQVHSQTAKRCFPCRCEEARWKSCKVHSFTLCLCLCVSAQVENRSHLSEKYKYCITTHTAGVSLFWTYGYFKIGFLHHSQSYLLKSTSACLHCKHSWVCHWGCRWSVHERSVER